MTSVFSWSNLLTFALLHIVLQGQTCLLFQVSLDFYFCIPILYDEKEIFFFLVLILEGVIEFTHKHQTKIIQKIKMPYLEE